MIRHCHSMDDTAPWHDGSLADCPETIKYLNTTIDGQSYFLCEGFSVSGPSDEERQAMPFRRLSNVEPIV